MRCELATSQPLLVLSENKSVIRILNGKNRNLILKTVDGCLINDGVRCDYLVVDDETQKESFIELKGGNVEHAVKQLVSSVARLTSNLNAEKTAYVICTRSPLTGPAIQKLQKQLRRDNIILRIKKTVHEESVDSLFCL